jgi:hypothetical protein
MVDTRQGATVAFYSFDPSFGFNDATASGFYAFKMEEIIPGRVPTVRKIIVVYRDLGLATVGFFLTGTLFTAPSGQQLVSNSTTVTLGTASKTGRLMTALVDLELTAMDMQLTINRAANAGPVSIVKIIMCGQVEVDQEF